MRASTGSGDAWALPAVPSAIGELRRRAAAFASEASAIPKMTYATGAVSETVTNAVMHAYAGRSRDRSACGVAPTSSAWPAIAIVCSGSLVTCTVCMSSRSCFST